MYSYLNTQKIDENYPIGIGFGFLIKLILFIKEVIFSKSSLESG